MRFIVTLLLFVPMFAHAGSTTIAGCSPPNQRSDGTSLSANEISGYNWYINGRQEGSTTDCQAGTRITTTLPDGNYTVEATTVDSNGLESITMSNSVIKTFTTAAPNPPVLQ